MDDETWERGRFIAKARARFVVYDVYRFGECHRAPRADRDGRSIGLTGECSCYAGGYVVDGYPVESQPTGGKIDAPVYLQFLGQRRQQVLHEIRWSHEAMNEPQIADRRLDLGMWKITFVLGSLDRKEYDTCRSVIPLEEPAERDWIRQMRRPHEKDGIECSFGADAPLEVYEQRIDVGIGECAGGGSCKKTMIFEVPLAKQCTPDVSTRARNKNIHFELLANHTIAAEQQGSQDD